jgi:hypothetical protein
MYTEQTRCTLRKDSWQNHLQTFAEAQPEFLQRFSIAQQESGSSNRGIDGGSHVSYWVVLGTIIRTSAKFCPAWPDPRPTEQSDGELQSNDGQYLSRSIVRFEI